MVPQTIVLTDAQEKRLSKLEDTDPAAKVVGHLFGMPVLLHSGVNRNGYHHLAMLGPGGRLRGLGEQQEIIFNRIHKERNGQPRASEQVGESGSG